MKKKVAIIGSGNIGTDLMIKVIRTSEVLEMAAMVGIDPESDGLRRAAAMGVATTHEGVEGLKAMDVFEEIEIVFDATAAKAHEANARALEGSGKRLVDLTPAALGPYVVPPVNGDQHIAEGADNVNMVTCGGQATIPMVAAVNRVSPVHYGEIVASIASKSAGPGTRANIDEFTETTSAAIEKVGGATRGKAIIILNPAEPPLIMRDTVLCLTGDVDQDAVRRSVEDMAEQVRSYVPGYRLVQDVQFTPVTADEVRTLVDADVAPTTKITVFLEVEGAAHYLPAYAGNLDIMTSAALRTAEQMTAGAPELAAATTEAAR
ncbi:acetaldehyde dehydrogenase (acetylating) [Janibacter corallicola]|uniref:acetaldehyde dehydrogenase (acetylating) n=1 Tax=Janibacter corallicola TaxID=415212 RepID=UPI000835D344|nr:acetaldehyde dehydrogenase (acetylating) [Janibacter corallicola]